MQRLVDDVYSLVFSIGYGKVNSVRNFVVDNSSSISNGAFRPQILFRVMWLIFLMR